jgi:dihydrofolate reductase
MISIISAIGKNNEIGRKNDLLWNMPADMKHFRETTSGHTVIMGQRTFESLGTDKDGNPGKPLPNRRNIIITLNETFKREGVEVVHSLDELLNLIKEINEEVFVIGGGQIYKLMIEHADKLYITHVDASFPDADTFFPKIDSSWKETLREEHPKDEKNAYPYAFSIYERIS